MSITYELSFDVAMIAGIDLLSITVLLRETKGPTSAAKIEVQLVDHHVQSSSPDFAAFGS